MGDWFDATHDVEFPAPHTKGMTMSVDWRDFFILGHFFVVCVGVSVLAR